MSYEVTEILNLGPFMENCYVMTCAETRQAVVIDPGDNPGKILQTLQSLDIKPRLVFLTHPHIDHVLAVPEVMKKYSIPLWLPEWDEELYSGLATQCQLYGLPPHQPVKEYTRYNASHTVQVGSLRATILHTPGHTPGSCCLYFAAQKVLFGGDLLFFDSIGRTDLWGGSPEQMTNSLRSLGALPDDITVYPGHGPRTLLGREKHHNLFLRSVLKGRSLSELSS